MITILLLFQGAATPSTDAPSLTAPQPLVDALSFPQEGEKTIQIGGRLQSDWGFVSQNSASEAAFGMLEDGTEIRRARLRVFGDLGPGVSYKMEYDFADDVDNKVKDAWVRYDGWDCAKVTVGHQYEPLGFETQTSSRFITFLERSTVQEAIAPARNAGLRLDGSRDRSSWSAGAFRDTGDDGASSDEGWGVTGRYVFRPYHEKDGRRLMHLGAAASLRVPDSGARFRARPENHLLPRYVDTGMLTADEVILAGLEFGLVEGPFHAMAEYMQAEPGNDDGAPEPSLHGWTVSGGWFITGESRGYKAGGAVWGRTSPSSPAFVDGGMGAVEVALRFSSLDLTEAAAVSDELDTVTVGLNWTVNKYTRTMLDWTNASLGDADSDTIALRIAIDW